MLSLYVRELGAVSLEQAVARIGITAPHEALRLALADAEEAFDLDSLLCSVLQELKEKLAAAELETAHMKCIGMADGNHAVANLVSSDSDVDLSLTSGCRTRQADMNVNANR